MKISKIFESINLSDKEKEFLKNALYYKDREGPTINNKSDIKNKEYEEYNSLLNKGLLKWINVERKGRFYPGLRISKGWNAIEKLLKDS